MAMKKTQDRELAFKKKELYKLAVARSDITAALNISELFISTIKDLSDPLYYPLQNALIVCYSRPFSSNKPLGPLSKKWHKFEDANLQAAHEDILEMRDKVIAHSDLKVRKVRIYPPGTPIDKKGLKSGGLGLAVNDYWIVLENFPSIRAACYDLGNRLNVEVKTLLHSIYGGLELPPEAIELTF